LARLAEIGKIKAGQMEDNIIVAERDVKALAEEVALRERSPSQPNFGTSSFEKKATTKSWLFCFPLPFHD